MTPNPIDGYANEFMRLYRSGGSAHEIARHFTVSENQIWELFRAVSSSHVGRLHCVECQGFALKEWNRCSDHVEAFARKIILLEKPAPASISSGDIRIRASNMLHVAVGFMTASEIAKSTGISRKNVYDWTRKGFIPREKYARLIVSRLKKNIEREVTA